MLRMKRLTQNWTGCLETAPCVEIGGIGGIGKSQAAAACLLRSERRFEYRFWVSGRDIDSVERLSSVPVRRCRA